MTKKKKAGAAAKKVGDAKKKAGKKAGKAVAKAGGKAGKSVAKSSAKSGLLAGAGALAAGALGAGVLGAALGGAGGGRGGASGAAYMNAGPCACRLCAETMAGLQGEENKFTPSTDVHPAGSSSVPLERPRNPMNKRTYEGGGGVKAGKTGKGAKAGGGAKSGSSAKRL